MDYHFNLFSSIGLFFDIIGVLFLFKFGLPSKITEGSYFMDGETKEEERERIEKNNHISRMAHLGLWILFLGFILQLIGSNFS